MPDDDTTSTHAGERNLSKDAAKSDQQTQQRGWFSIPPALKEIFDRYPLVEYARNELPLRAPRKREENVLYIFTTERDARAGRASFNPACLKWQTYMKFTEIAFQVRPSSNHASPSGALPFLLPASPSIDSEKPVDPVPSNKLRKWLSSQSGTELPAEPEDVRYEAYGALVEGAIRKAWLYQLYINSANRTLLHRLYTRPNSTNPFVQAAIVHQLRSAATAELTKTTFTISEAALMHDAEEAFAALSQLLGEENWFFQQDSPGLFDANIFAYTHLILDERFGWGENRLKGILEGYANLVAHRDRIREMYF
ncbi:hypothetical protein MBLNU230_g6705t1 [Neophaeotheca triangularis]